MGKIKAERDKGYPIHQYIPDPVVRNRCLYYILLLANYMAAKECKVQEAKDPTREIIERLIENKSYGLVDSPCCDGPIFCKPVKFIQGDTKRIGDYWVNGLEAA